MKSPKVVHTIAGLLALSMLSTACLGSSEPGLPDIASSSGATINTSATSTTAATTSTGPTECRTSPAGPSTYRYAVRPDTDALLNSLDIYLPAVCGPAPAIVWVHGGGWRSGDTSQGLVQRKAAWAASLGAALVAVNYRLSTPGSGVRWPDHGNDVATAPSRKLIEAAFGTDPAVLADASPTAQIELNDAPDARFLVGTRGGRSRVAEAQRFVDLINYTGGSARLLDANPYEHSGMSSQLGAPAEQVVTPEVTAFVRTCNPGLKKP